MLRVKTNDYQPPQTADEPEAVDSAAEDAAEPQDMIAHPMEMMHGGGQVAQDVARYLPPDAVCANCVHFMEPNTCEIVAGQIEPQGRCSLFTADQQESMMTGEQPTESDDNGNVNQPPSNTKLA